MAHARGGGDRVGSTVPRQMEQTNVCSRPDSHYVWGIKLTWGWWEEGLLREMGAMRPEQGHLVFLGATTPTHPCSVLCHSAQHHRSVQVNFLLS